MNVLYVGDPHVTVDALPECEALCAKIEQIIKDDTSIEALVILGDLHHNHALVHVEVLQFWRRWLTAFSSMVPTFVVKGNHDISGDESSTAHALIAYGGISGLKIASRNPVLHNGILFVPYSTEKDFVATCNHHYYKDAKVVVCHQTFYGAVYENGFPVKKKEGVYDPHAIDPNDIPQPKIISGHIHTPQSFGKVWYVGAPRWRSVSDANVRRHIKLINHPEGREDEYTVVQAWDTSDVCKPIEHLTVTPETEILIFAFEQAKLVFDIKGPADFVEKQKKLLKTDYPGARIRTQITGGNAIIVKESEGISTAFGNFLHKYVPKHGTPKEILKALARNRLNVQFN